MENKQLNIKDFFNYYLSKCKKGCLDEIAFTMHFHPFWMFVQNNKHLEHIPILRSNGTSYFLLEQEILKKVVEHKNK